MYITTFHEHNDLTKADWLIYKAFCGLSIPKVIIGDFLNEKKNKVEIGPEIQHFPKLLDLHSLSAKL